jgi:4-amino-4-deoxy-L-arabinose transferase-like glycosyltransferase
MLRTFDPGREPVFRPILRQLEEIRARSDLAKLEHALTAALDWLAASHIRAVAALLLLALACFLPGQASIPPVDRDEARYAQATTQMLETGDFVDIRLHDQPRHYQPAGIYWLQALAVKLSGADLPAPIAVHRLPSLIGACLIVLLAYWAALPFGRRVALVAGAMMAALLLLNVEARLAKTDAALNAAILLCQAVLLRLYLGDRHEAAPLAYAIAFWVAAGVGVMVKGPILVVIVGLTVAAASALARDIGWLRGLRPLIGLPIACLIVLPWYVAIWFATDGAFYAKAIGYSVTGKLATGMQSHGGPPGYYLAAFFVSAWPVAAVAVSALPSLWRERQTAFVRFVAAWVLPAWIGFEMIATKLPHYVLPLYPAIALVAAAALAGDRIEAERWWVRLLLYLAAVGPVATVAVAIGASIWLEGRVPALSVVLGAVVVALALLAAALIEARALLAGWLVLAAVAAPVTYACVFGAIAPRLQSLWLSPRLAAATVAVAGCTDPKVIAVGNNEASLIFAVGTDIAFGSGEDAADFLAGDGCRAAIVEEASEPAFAAGLAELGLVPAPTRRVAGINIANGRRLDFGVYGPPR